MKKAPWKAVAYALRFDSVGLLLMRTRTSKLHDNMLFVSETVVKPLYAHTGKVTLVH